MSEQEIIRSVPEIISFLENRWKEKNLHAKGPRGISTYEILEFCGRKPTSRGGKYTVLVRELFEKHQINWECTSKSGWLPKYKISFIETKDKEKNNEQEEISSLTENFTKKVREQTNQIPVSDPRLFAINSLAQQGLHFLLQVIQTVATMNLSNSATQTTEQPPISQ